MKKLRVSWTLLDLWRKGQIDEAVRFYLKLERETTVEMEEGKNWHKKNEEHIKKHGKFLPEFGGGRVYEPLLEKRIEMDYNELFELVGKPDVYDEETKTLYELKTGKYPSNQFINSPQLGIYSLLLQSKNKPVEKIVVIRFDGKETDWAMRWFYPEIVEEAKNFIDSLAPEIYQFFEKEGII